MTAVALLLLAACGDDGESRGGSGTTVNTPPSPPGVPCTAGAQCDSGFCVAGFCCGSASCPAGQFCNTGQCTPPDGNGLPCNDDAQCLTTFCVDGFCCESRTCPDGQFCNTGGCRPPGPNGDPCNAAPCVSGFCVDGVCCASASCPAGEFCNIAVSRGTCGPRRTTGDRCEFDSDCASANCSPGLFSACGPPTTPHPSGLGTSCGDAGQCASGNCVDAVCCESARCPVGQRCNLAGTAGRCAEPPTATPTATPTSTRTATPTPRRVALRVTSASGAPGQQVTITVGIDTGRLLVAGTQNDISFDPLSAPIAARTSGAPDCTVNPDINKGDTAFAFQPAGCNGATCTSLRALVLSLHDVAPIPDGTILYSCTVAISLDAVPSTYTLALSGVVASAPDGRALPTEIGGSGTITVIAPPFPTPTAGPSVDVGSASGGPGDVVAIDVTLVNGRDQIAAASNDIVYDPTQVSVALLVDGNPDCAINPAIGPASAVSKSLVASQPDGGGLRVGVIGTDNANRIPDGLLFTCKFAIAANATPGATLLRNIPGASDAAANAVAVGGTSGRITVVAASA